MDRLHELLDAEDQEGVYQIILGKQLPETTESLCQEDLYCLFMSLLPETAAETIPYLVDWMFKSGFQQDYIVSAARDFIYEYVWIACDDSVKKAKYRPFFVTCITEFDARRINLTQNRGKTNADLLAIINRQR